jgi:hypothetical protein
MDTSHHSARRSRRRPTIGRALATLAVTAVTTLPIISATPASAEWYRQNWGTQPGQVQTGQYVNAYASFAQVHTPYAGEVCTGGARWACAYNSVTSDWNYWTHVWEQCQNDSNHYVTLNCYEYD